ncbi:MAG: DUF1553 domain-containing protein [Planctomycetes bacterium]|nr:DUF1553 domain-containing protein [Planctomycetota bacterium]
MMRALFVGCFLGAMFVFGAAASRGDELPPEAASAAQFTRHVSAVFSRLGCAGGTCHGAVKGKNGFRLSLFGADTEHDFEQIVLASRGRRISLAAPAHSLILQKATGRVPHGGGKRMAEDSAEYEILRRWIAGGAKQDAVRKSRIVALQVDLPRPTMALGTRQSLRVRATFADGSAENVTGLCSFQSLDRQVADVDRDGLVRAVGVGDAALIVRYRSEPAVVTIIVPRSSRRLFPKVAPANFIDVHILKKLQRLNIPPSTVAGDATFLRRVTLDVAGRLPTSDEVRSFLADRDAEKRTKKIDELLRDPGYSALWALKFCDILMAADFGVYADGLKKQHDAPRFYAWIRARLEENTPYDEFAERILTATGREGRTLEAWGDEVVALFEGYSDERTDIAIYAKRKTLDLYWQRKGAAGLPGALQVAHAFLGLRLQCAQCHRHPSDIWQQDDLLSFANFFMRVRAPGFRGENKKNFPEAAALAERFIAEGKQLTEQARQLKGQNNDDLKSKIRVMERRGKLLQGDVAKRILHAEIRHLPDQVKAATITSPLGTQTSKQFRLLGETAAIEIDNSEDPRVRLAAWMRRADNPFFAKALVNRVWAHYFGRGIVDPPDDLSPLNPATHPELLADLSRKFVEHRFDLKWLHRTILSSRTYQQSSLAVAANAMDRSNYARFYYRRLPAEVLVDALNQATGTGEEMGMQYEHWPQEIKTIEIPYAPKNTFVNFMLEQFGRSARNSAVQCDCQRESAPSVLQVLSLINHPRIHQKIADPKGRVARILKTYPDDASRIEELFLATLSRLPDDGERAACLKYIRASASAEAGLRGVMWSLLNTREFILQH